MSEIAFPATIATAATYSSEETEAMQRAVLALFEHWGLSDAQAAILLGGVSTRTLARWRKREYGRLTLDQCDRISHLLGIHKALRIIFTDAERAYTWVKKPNRNLGDKSALDVMLAGHMRHIERIRLYLDSVRGA